MILRPPRSTRTDTLFPYTTLFRSYYVAVTVAEIVDAGTELENKLVETDPDKLGLLVTPNQIVLEPRSEEHTSELPSLMRISYAVFCLKKKTPMRTHTLLLYVRPPP